MRLFTVLACLVATAPASASTITFAEGSDSDSRGNVFPVQDVVVTAAPGELNRMSIDIVDDGVRIRDVGGPLASAGRCRAEAPGAVFCPVPPRLKGSVMVDLGDGDDLLRVGTRYARVVVEGGTGDDDIRGAFRADGGPGDDHLGALTMVGGPGADRFDPSGEVQYSDARSAGVTVTRDGLANDGAPGEGDDVRAGRIVGTPHADVLVGSEGDDELLGAGGLADRLTGGGGDDFLYAAPVYVGAADAVNGGAVLDGGAGHDNMGAYASPGQPGNTLRGGPGDDLVQSNFGADRLDGGPGRDTLESGDGDDVVTARDGGLDLVDCGAGADVAAADEADFPGRCDRVDRAGAPAHAIVRYASVRSSIVAFGLGCPPDGPRVCVVTVRSGGRTLLRRARLRPDAAPDYTDRKGRLRRGSPLVLTTTDARGRPYRQTLRLR